MKKKTIKWIKLILKYLIPVVLGWIEGDSHAVTSALSSVVDLFI